MQVSAAASSQGILLAWASQALPATLFAHPQMLCDIKYNGQLHTTMSHQTHAQSCHIKCMLNYIQPHHIKCMGNFAQLSHIKGMVHHTATSHQMHG